MVDTHIIGSNMSVGDGVLKAGTLSLTQLIDLTSYRQMEFYGAASFKNVQTLDVHREFTKRHTGGVFDSSEGGMVPFSTDEVFEKYTHLGKKRFAAKLTDESKIRRDMPFQMNSALDRAAETFANARDIEILGKIKTGYGVTKNASAKWDAAGADVIGDVGALLDELFDQDEVSVRENDINNMIIYYPLKLYSQIREPARLMAASSQVASRIQVNTTDMEWLGNTYGITWVGSTKLNYLANAYAVIPTPDKTLDHYTYVGPDVPGVERDRDVYSGSELMIHTKYFGSMVIPESEDQLNSNFRIMRIATVCDASTVTL
jgi:hypothetical protein